MQDYKGLKETTASFIYLKICPTSQNGLGYRGESKIQAEHGQLDLCAAQGLF
jgi:hypothetical protein